MAVYAIEQNFVIFEPNDVVLCVMIYNENHEVRAKRWIIIDADENI